MVLLSGHAYSIGGAVILLEDGGVILRMSKNELNEFKQLINQYKIYKRLQVVNNTYEAVRRGRGRKPPTVYPPTHQPHPT